MSKLCSSDTDDPSRMSLQLCLMYKICLTYLDFSNYLHPIRILSQKLIKQQNETTEEMIAALKTQLCLLFVSPFYVNMEVYYNLKITKINNTLLK